MHDGELEEQGLRLFVSFVLFYLGSYSFSVGLLQSLEKLVPCILHVMTSAAYSAVTVPLRWKFCRPFLSKLRPCLMSWLPHINYGSSALHNWGESQRPSFHLQQSVNLKQVGLGSFFKNELSLQIQQTFIGMKMQERNKTPQACHSSYLINSDVFFPLIIHTHTHTSYAVLQSVLVLILDV